MLCKQYTATAEKREKQYVQYLNTLHAS